MPSALRLTLTVVLGAGLTLASETALIAAAVDPSSQEPPAARKGLYRVEVRDALEAALLEEQLKLKPELVRERFFYYRGDAALNARLVELGFEPVEADERDVLTRVVRVIPARDEQRLRDLGVLVILKEPKYWWLRATLRQLDALGRAGFKVEPARPGQEPRPRQVRILVDRLETVREAIAPRIDVYTVEGYEKRYAVFGAAFDDAIEALQRAGFKVEILPDPKGVVR